MPDVRSAIPGSVRSAPIDGLRVVAVLLVVIAHAARGGPPILVGVGDHGVNLFSSSPVCV